MGKYFSISELISSTTATSKGISNIPPENVKAKLQALIDNALDPVREKWGAPIIVNSGYRCPALNKAIGGASNSQHMTGEAADITAGNLTKNKKLFDMIAASGLPFDQLIDEQKYTWLHISYKKTGNRKQILHL